MISMRTALARCTLPATVAAVAFAPLQFIPTCAHAEPPLFDSHTRSFDIRPLGTQVIQIADMTGDGLNDVVVGGFGIIEVFPGTGTQRLGDRLVSLSLGQPAGTIELVDFDVDGVLDIVAAGDLAFWQRGNSSGFFGAAVGFFWSTYWNYQNPGPPVIAADVTQDGIPDVLFASSEFLRIRPGLGGGATDSAYIVDVRCHWELAVADLNGDSIPDLLAADDRSVCRFVEGLGGGAFASAVDIGPGGRTLYVIDVDGDAELDVVCGGRFYKGAGNGTFTFQDSLGYEPDALADVDGDGWLDVITLGPESISIRFGTGLWTFAPPQEFLTGRTPVDIAVGDVNNDGITDLAAVCDGSESVVVLFGTTPRGFVQPETFLAGEGPSAMAAGEFTGDALVDLVTANRRDRTVTLLPNLGASFGPPLVYPAAAGLSDLVAVDLNADGRLDVATVSDSSATLSIYLGQIGGGLAPRVDYPAGVQPTALAVGDLNGDPFVDVAVLEGEQQRFFLMLGGPSGFSASAASWVVPGKGHDIVIFDADGDGLQDVLVQYSKWPWSSGVQSYRGDGAGGVTNSYQLAGVSGRGVIEVAEITGDGTADLAIASKQDSASSVATRLWVYEGSSTPPALAFSSGPDTIGPVVTDLAFADVDGDGITDALTASANANGVTVRLGLPGSGFGARTDYIAGVRPTALVALDFDLDGDIDIATANGGSNTVSLLVNQTPNGPTPALAALVEAIATPRAAQITWHVETEQSLEVERRIASTAWTAITSLTPDGTRRVFLEDDSVAQGTRYGYRLRWSDAQSGEVIAGEVWLEVPVLSMLQLHGAAPNPARGTVHVAFSLPDDAPASLELWDVAGRRIASMPVGSLGPGEHRIALPAAPNRPGLYFLRLVRNGVTVTRRVAVAR